MGLLALALCLQQATLHAEPDHAQVGQPVKWTLVVEHDVDETVLLDDLQIVADDTWVQLSGPQVVRVRDGEQAGTCIDWHLFSLEAGERSLPPLAVSLSSGLTIEALAGVLTITGDLGPTEDAPRPIGGPVAAPKETQLAKFSPLYGFFLLLIPLAFFFVRRRKVDSSPLPPEPPVDLDQLLESNASPGDFALALSKRLRDSIDGAQGVSRRAMLAEEWLKDVRARGGIESNWIGEAADLLSWADGVAFARIQPSKMALSDSLQRAQALLARSQPQEVEA